MYSHHFMHQLNKTVICGTNTIKSHVIKMAYTHFILNILKLYPFLSLLSPLKKDSELDLGINSDFRAQKILIQFPAIICCKEALKH